MNGGPDLSAELTDREYAAWADLECSLLGGQVQQTSVDKYAYALLRLARWLRAQRPGLEFLDMTSGDLSAFLAWLTDKKPRGAGLSIGSAETYWRAYRRMWRYWIGTEYVAEVITATMPAIRLDETVMPSLRPDEVAALLAACAGKTFRDRRDLAMIRVALCPGGPRATEVAELEMDQLDLRGGTILVRGKGRKERLVPLGPPARQALVRYLGERAKQPGAARSRRLFLSARHGGEPMTRSGFQDVCNYRAILAGLTKRGPGGEVISAVHPHMLRHTIAAQCKAAKLDPESAKILFGWRGDAMYARYGRAAAAALAVQQGAELALQLG